MADIIDPDISFLSGFKPKEVPLTDEDVKHPNVQAYLNYLNTYEGKPAPNQTVGYKEFKDLSDHPRQKVVFNKAGDTSDAAGSYQIKGDTWNIQKKKLGLKDFTFPNQQKAAVGVLKDIGALPYIQSGEFDKANELARGQWASLPGSTIGLKTGQIPQLKPEAEKILSQAKAEYDPDVSFIEGFKPKTKLTDEDLSKPFFGNPNLTRQGEKSKAITKSGFVPFVEDIAKPLSQVDITKSTPALLLKGTVGGQQSRMEVAEEASKQSEALVNAIRNFANNPDKLGTIQKGLINAYEHPGEVLGGAVAGTIMHPEQIPIGGAVGKVIGKVAEPIGSAASQAFKDVAETPEFQRIVARAKTIKDQSKNAIGSMQDVFQQAKQAGAPKASVTVEGAPNVGAALTTKQSAVDAILPDLSPETQSIVKSTPVEKLNIPALETKALEEKHGIRLSQGQRTEDVGRYAQEWNQRASDQRIQDLFSNQPEQFKNAIENIKERHTPLMGDAKGEDFGQILMDEYASNDAAHVKAIQKSYGDLKQRHNEMLAERGFPAESGMPLDTQAFVNHAKNNLHDEFLMSDAEKSGLMGDLSRIEKNGMTLPEFIAFDKRLSRMQRGADKEAAAAAGQIRNAFEQIPLKDGMEELMPQYKASKDLARQRFEKLETIPGYKFAVEAKPFVNEAGEQMGSTGANKFYNNFINNLSTGDLRRVKAEFANNPKALEAIKGAELEKIVKKAGFTGDMGKFTPKQLNDYLVNNSAGLVEKLGPEAVNDLMEINVLGAKVAKPDAGVFNHSNSLSGLFGSLAKQGMQTKAEAALAAKTGGASILPVQALKSAAEFINKGKFASETVHPHSGLINKD